LPQLPLYLPHKTPVYILHTNMAKSINIKTEMDCTGIIVWIVDIHIVLHMWGRQFKNTPHTFDCLYCNDFSSHCSMNVYLVHKSRLSYVKYNITLHKLYTKCTSALCHNITFTNIHTFHEHCCYSYTYIKEHTLSRKARSLAPIYCSILKVFSYICCINSDCT